MKKVERIAEFDEILYEKVSVEIETVLGKKQQYFITDAMEYF